MDLVKKYLGRKGQKINQNLMLSFWRGEKLNIRTVLVKNLKVEEMKRTGSRAFSTLQLLPLLLQFMNKNKSNFFQKITDWENWPLPFFQFPMGIVWLWFCLKSRSVWFFSSSNPSLEFGGFEGEGKREMYAQLPPGTFPKTVFFEPKQLVSNVLETVAAEKFRFPVAVKPDVGMKGLLFRRIEDAERLAFFHARCPVDYMVQEWVDLPIELSVFYIRHPNSRRGEITGMTWKEPIEVTGDGQNDLLFLIKNTPRAAERVEELAKKHTENLTKILPDGEKYLLTIAANRQRGARLHNLKHEIDAQLIDVFDKISLHAGQFFWGRYDVKCRSLEDLRQGKNFQILEFNGAGAAPNHIYHAGLSFGEAWREVAKNWRALFEISRHNHQNGVKYWSFRRGLNYLKNARQHFQMLEKLEHEL